MLESVETLEFIAIWRNSPLPCTGFEHFRNIKDNVNKQLNKMYNNGLVVLDILMQKCYILYP